MNVLLIMLMTLIAVCPVFTCSEVHATDPRTLTFPSLEFKPPLTERIVLSNGMVVHLLQDRELPLVSIQAYIGVGSVHEPADKVGLAGLTGTVMRSGGTGSLEAEALDRELEFMASSIETAIGTDAGTAAMSCLTKHLDRTLTLFAHVLTQPAFRQDRLEQARNRALEAIRRQNDDPQQLADRELAKALYQGHPLGRQPSSDSLHAITGNDLITFHHRFFHPNNVILAVAGDFNRETIVKQLEQAFAGWQAGEAHPPQVTQPVGPEQPAVLFIQKAIDQSVIRMGHLGIDKNNPDLHALAVMNAILGGNGFSSRLMTVIRSKEGLAYNVASSFQAGRRYRGTFEAETETKPSTTVHTIRLMQELITAMTREPVSDRELALAKESIINSFMFAFTNSASVAAQRARLEYYGFPKGYLETYRDAIAKVTREDVLRVARTYLQPNAMTLVVVGDGEKFDKPLATLGAVRTIDPLAQESSLKK